LKTQNIKKCKINHFCFIITNTCIINQQQIFCSHIILWLLSSVCRQWFPSNNFCSSWPIWEMNKLLVIFSVIYKKKISRRGIVSVSDDSDTENYRSLWWQTHEVTDNNKSLDIDYHQYHSSCLSDSPLYQQQCLSRPHNYCYSMDNLAIT